MTGGDTAQIKRINTNLIRRTMLAGNAWTKDMLAAQTGLSTATCRKILMEMLESCEVTELSPADPKGGRPARRFRVLFTIFFRQYRYPSRTFPPRVFLRPKVL